MANEKSSNIDIVAIARAAYEAYVAKDRAAIEDLIAPDFHFSSPLDNRIDRATYFARCWPNSKTIIGFDFINLVPNRDVGIQASRRGLDARVHDRVPVISWAMPPDRASRRTSTARTWRPA